MQHTDEQLAKILEKLSEFAPQYGETLVQEILTYGLVNNIVWLVISSIITIIAIALGLLLIRCIYRADSSIDTDSREFYGACAFGCGLFSIVSFVVGISGLIASITCLIKITCAPNLYALESLMEKFI